MNRKIDEDELQKAIDDITNGTENVAEEIVAAETGQAAEAAPVAAVNEAEAAVPAVEQPAQITEQPIQATVAEQPANPQIGVDLGAVKASALADLRPILETAEIAPENKFKIYREIIVTGRDSGAIGPAYAVARSITDEKVRAAALLFIIEVIDSLSVVQNN